MSDESSKTTSGVSRATIEVADGEAPVSTVSGRPAFDSRGRTVWEWQIETGVFSRDASTTRVQRLQPPDLALEKTIVGAGPGITQRQLDEAPGGGFNPYDRAMAVKPEKAAHRPTVRLPPTKPVIAVRRRPVTLFERLRALLGGR